MYKSAFVFFFFALLSWTEAEAQLSRNGKNTLTIGTGRTRNFLEESAVRAWGADYLRVIGESKWEWGIQLDLDFEKNLSEFEGFSTAAIAAYSITPNWPFFAGGGMRFEGHENEAFARIGTEYAFFFSQTSPWFFSPGIFCDYGSDGFTPSLMWVIGVRF